MAETGWLSIPGETPEIDIEFIVGQVEGLSDDAVIVELGSLLGRTTVAVALKCIGTARKIFTVDNFNVKAHLAQGGWVEPSLAILIKNLEDNGVIHLVMVIEGDTYDVGFDWQGPRIDCLIHDADHHYDAVCGDLRVWLPHVKTGGIILVHDWGNDSVGVHQACLAILGEPQKQHWLTGMWVKK